jgi:hypothetical protein
LNAAQLRVPNLIGMSARKGDTLARESSDSTSWTPFVRHCLGKLIRTQSIVARSMSAGDLFDLRMAEFIDLVCHFPHHPGFMCCNCVIELGIPHRPRKEVALRDGASLRRRSCVGPLFFKCRASGLSSGSAPYRPHFLRQ